MQEKTEIPSAKEEDASSPEKLGEEDPPVIKKLKGQIKEGKGIGLNPVKLGKFKRAIRFTDVRLEFVKFLKEHLRHVREQGGDSSQLDEETMKDILTLVGTAGSRGNFGEDLFFKKETKQEHDALTEEEKAVKAQDNYLVFKKHFSELWAEVMRWKMTPSVHRKVVILLPEKIMLHLTKPLHMSDFLLESFKLGGPVSLVSLHGIFLLMQNFNFEVPDFYSRLYSMFTSETLCSKYRARFFAYSREFLSSTHLPEAMVASFIKRMSRLSLLAPACTLPMLFDFITNLIIQHPGLKIMLNPVNQDRKPKIPDIQVPDFWSMDFEAFSKLHQEGSLPSVESPDPFDEHETDPMKTRAMESWLCEIKTLQNHSVSSIALQAKFINKAIPKVERDMDESLSLTYEDLEEQEIKLSLEQSKPEGEPSSKKTRIQQQSTEDE